MLSSPGRAVVLVAFVTLIVASAAEVRAASLRGELSLPSNLAALVKLSDLPPPQWDEWNGVLTPQPDSADASRHFAVVLTGSTSAEPPRVALSGGTLMPSTIVVREGQTLTIENTDPFSHKLYSSEVEGFTPLQTAPGNSRSVKFPKAGVFSIRDASHAFVRGTVHVLPDVSAHAEVSSSGRFRFADVPNGSYTLKVFFRDRLVASQPVQVDGPREANLGTVDAPAAKLSSTGN